MIDLSRIKRNLQELSFPRRYGTNSEKLAFEKIKNKIEKLGLKTESHSFVFSTFYSNVLLKIYVVLVFIILFLKYLNVTDIIFILFLGIVIFISFLLFLVSRNPEKIKFGKKQDSQNLLVKLNSEAEMDNMKEMKKKLIFIAHVDSKGQTLPIIYRIVSYYVWIISVLIIIIVFFLRYIFQTQFFLLFHSIASGIMVLNLISCILILINISNNNSDGALDNATGIAIVLELLHHFQIEKVQSKNYDFWFLFTGAEEVGTMGARFFLNSLQKYDKNEFIIINFDTIGKGIGLFKFGEEKNDFFKFINLIFKSARDYNLVIKKGRKIIGVHSDGWVSAKKGFNGIGFGDISVYKYVHRKYTIDKVDYELLCNFCQVIASAINHLDDNNQFY